MRPARSLAVALTGAVLALPAPAQASAAVPALPAAARASAAVLALPAPAWASGAPGTLKADLDRVLADKQLAGATVAVDVRDAVSGTVLYQRNPEIRVVPASNQKLLTAAAALEILGAGYRFRTTVRSRAGDLYLQGKGDPTMTYERFDRLAGVVARGKAKRFTRLVADDTWFDRVPLGLDWSWEDEPYGYQAPISALTFAANARFDTGAVEIRYQGVAGRRPTVRVWPPTTSVRVINRSVTRAGGDDVRVTRAHGTPNITVSGSVAAGRSGTAVLSVPDSAATAAGLFRTALRRHGVTVTGRTVKGPTPTGTRVLTAQTSPPLSALLQPFLKLSNNGHAELLVKAMSRATSPARPGGWPTGLTAATAALGRLGVDTRLLTMGDGSGLSRRNWLTVRQLTTLLRSAQRRTWFPAFRAALPVAGDPALMVGGTLRNRMRGTPAAGVVRAKTGTLTGVNALSGYTSDTTGRRLVFAVIINGSTASASTLLDTVATTLTTHQPPPPASSL